MQTCDVCNAKHLAAATDWP